MLKLMFSDGWTHVTETQAINWAKRMMKDRPFDQTKEERLEFINRSLKGIQFTFWKYDILHTKTK